MEIWIFGEIWKFRNLEIHEFSNLESLNFRNFSWVVPEVGCNLYNRLATFLKSEHGENAVIAAGSIVKMNVDKETVVGGCPAKLIKEINLL